MNVVITELQRDYGNGYSVYKTIEDALKTNDAIDTLIYNKASDEDTVEPSDLIDLLNRASRIYYVRNRGSLNDLIVIITIAKRGVLVSNESCLLNAVSLRELIEDYTQVIKNSIEASPRVLEVLVSKLANNEQLTPNYVSICIDAMNYIIQSYENIVDENRQNCESALKYLSNIINKRQVYIEEKVTEEETTKENARSNHGLEIAEVDGTMPNQLNFIRKNYNILLVKDMDRCRFLLSYIIGLQNYMTNILKIKTRVIILENAGVMAQAKYKDYKWVTRENFQQIGAISRESILFTDYPYQATMRNLLDDTSIFRCNIILDRTNYVIRHLFDIGDPKAIRYAIQSESSKKLANCSDSQCITSNTLMSNIPFVIKEDLSYTQLPEDFDKIQYYINTYKEDYHNLISNCESIKDYRKG